MVLWITGGEEVGQEIQDIVVSHDGKEPGGHHRNPGRLDGNDLPGIDARGGIGLHHVGGDPVIVTFEVHDPAHHFPAIPETEDAGTVLVTDFPAGVDNGLQKVVRGKPAGNRGKVRAHCTALVVESMAGKTGTCAEQLAAVLVIAPAFKSRAE